MFLSTDNTSDTNGTTKIQPLNIFHYGQKKDPRGYHPRRHQWYRI